MKSGWTSELRNRYFTWFYRELAKSGGESYKGFVEKIRLQALANVPAEEKAALAEASGEALLQAPAYNADVPPPVGPGRDWNINVADKLVREFLTDRSYQRGEELYQGLMCASCHTMNGTGGTVGPDLTQAGTRFSSRDLLNAMILPSVSISDQYGATLFTMSDGSTLIGRTLRTTEDSVFVSVNPFTLDSRGVPLSEVTSQVPSPVSLMPAGLINALNEQELLDFMAYLISGGDPENDVFATN
jgi:putative heme-binding domain-containing protein